MEQFGPKPFGGICAAAPGQIFRAAARGQRGDFRRLGVRGVIFPEPGHGVRMVGIRWMRGQRPAVPVNRQRRAAGGVHPDADDGGCRESTGLPARGAEDGPHGPDNALRVIGRLLAREIGVAPVKDNAVFAAGVVPDRGADFPPIGGVHQQRPRGIGAEIQTQRVFRLVAHDATAANCNAAPDAWGATRKCVRHCRAPPSARPRPAAVTGG